MGGLRRRSSVDSGVVGGPGVIGSVPGSRRLSLAGPYVDQSGPGSRERDLRHQFSLFTVSSSAADSGSAEAPASLGGKSSSHTAGGTGESDYCNDPHPRNYRDPHSPPIVQRELSIGSSSARHSLSEGI